MRAPSTSRLGSESLRGYLLLAPALVVAFAMLVVPLLALIVLSFWSQDYFVDRELSASR